MKNRERVVKRSLNVETQHRPVKKSPSPSLKRSANHVFVRCSAHAIVHTFATQHRPQDQGDGALSAAKSRRRPQAGGEAELSAPSP